MALFDAPSLDLEDLQVLAEIQQIREALAGNLRVPVRWQAVLRRNTQAKAVQGSNSIESSWGRTTPYQCSWPRRWRISTS